MAGTDTPADAASTHILLNPICNAQITPDSPKLVVANGKWTVSGSVKYFGCTGDALVKAQTTRQGEVCLQVLEGSAHLSIPYKVSRRTWRNVKCTKETFVTRAFGTYTLTASAACPARHQVRQYRIWQWIYLQRGPLTADAAGIGDRKFIDC
jgi:hypothetical protein